MVAARAARRCLVPCRAELLAVGRPPPRQPHGDGHAASACALHADGERRSCPTRQPEQRPVGAEHRTVPATSSAGVWCRGDPDRQTRGSWRRTCSVSSHGVQLALRWSRAGGGAPGCAGAPARFPAEHACDAARASMRPLAHVLGALAATTGSWVDLVWMPSAVLGTSIRRGWCTVVLQSLALQTRSWRQSWSVLLQSRRFRCKVPRISIQFPSKART